MEGVLTVENVRKIVQKDSDSRLVQELKVGQDVLGEQAILKLDRARLIAHVVALRIQSGQTFAVKGLVQDYDPSKASVESFELESAAAVKVGELKGVVTGVQGASADKPLDVNILFMSMMSVMQEQMRVSEERALKAEELRKSDLRLSEEKALKAE